MLPISVIDKSNDLGTVVNKVKISNLAIAAARELQQMAQAEENDNNNNNKNKDRRSPLWLFDEVQNCEVLNVSEYSRRFIIDETFEEIVRLITVGEVGEESLIMNANPLWDPYYNYGGFISEKKIGSGVHRTEDASRATAVVYADPLRIISMLMNVDQWTDAFCNIVSRASSLGFFSTGTDLGSSLGFFSSGTDLGSSIGFFSTGTDLGSPDGDLQVVRAVFHVPSPLVRTWELFFARYCRQLAGNTWLVTDVSLESIFNDIPLDCQRKPSGCLIQGLHEGISKVTWVENNAVDRSVTQDMFNLKVASGFPFSANRWIATLVRYYDRNSLMDQQFQNNSKSNDDREIMGRRIRQIPQPGLLLDVTGRNNLLKVATRMVRKYTANVTSCSENWWMPLPIIGGENTLFKTSLNTDGSGVPQGVTVTIATSVRLDFPHADIFNFLSNAQRRNKWDMLSHGRVTREIVRFSSGRDPSNWISLVLIEPQAAKIPMLYLQETFSDCTGLYVVHAPIDMAAMDHIAAGKNSDAVAILPCGFVVLPDTGGSILTIAFQILDKEASSAEHLPSDSMLTAHHIITTTVKLIMDELSTMNKN